MSAAASQPAPEVVESNPNQWNYSLFDCNLAVAHFLKVTFWPCADTVADGQDSTSILNGLSIDENSVPQSPAPASPRPSQQVQQSEAKKRTFAGIETRTSVRDRLGITQGSILQDVAVRLCCLPCGLTQEYLETHHREQIAVDNLRQIQRNRGHIPLERRITRSLSPVRIAYIVELASPQGSPSSPRYVESMNSRRIISSSVSSLKASEALRRKSDLDKDEIESEEEQVELQNNEPSLERSSSESTGEVSKLSMASIRPRHEVDHHLSV